MLLAGCYLYEVCGEAKQRVKKRSIGRITGSRYYQAFQPIGEQGKMPRMPLPDLHLHACQHVVRGQKACFVDELPMLWLCEGKYAPHIISDNRCPIADLGCCYQVRGGNDKHERGSKILDGLLASAGFGDERLAR